MEPVIHAALEEICSQLQDGLTLAALWPRLQPCLSSFDLDLSPGVKRAIWANLLRIPTLRFEVQEKLYSPVDPSIQSFEDAERLNLKILVQKDLRDNFLGLYEPQPVSTNQMRVLELLANSRANGITQSQLGKQLRIDGNNFHYVLKNLECQGLIVKQSALERKKETFTDGESKNYPCVSTHLVYLHRYAKQLGSHQRFEITKKEEKLKTSEDANRNASSGDMDVLIKDYTPQMKAICDKLAKANGKVLVVSDIKKDLGYCGSRSRQRAWREIFRRLKADRIVEQFDAKVNGKIEACLQLVDPGIAGSENEDQNLKSGKKCQVIDQYVELPVEHQIFDMIDSAGSDGITLKEICERLGIDLKKNHPRLINMCYRFGMKVREEQCQKSKTIRVWTSKNFNPEPDIAFVHKPDDNKVIDRHVPDPGKLQLYSDGGLADPGKLEDTTEAELSCKSPGNIESNYEEFPMNLQELALDPKGTGPNSKRDLVSAAAEEDVAPSGALPCTASYQGYLNFSFTIDSTRRAKRILERLEDEKFILRPEITRWLNSFEKDKPTKLDRKTVDRILSKLQEQGLCKVMEVYAPVSTQYNKRKLYIVVVHPSISSPSEIHDKIQDKIRSFTHCRSDGTSHQKDDESIPVIKDIQKSPSQIIPNGRAVKTEAMRANGFILAKMIRAKLLHGFLWDYLHSSSSHTDASLSERFVYGLNNPHSSIKLFSLEAAIKAIPVELFLQVVGSTQKYEELIDKCKMGLCLSDLPPEEYKCLMDIQATGRLSLVIDILRRLKLIRMVTDMQSRDGVKIPEASLTHMMELRPYIEEPLSSDAASLNFMSLDLRPRMRHDFILSNRDAVDEYWRTLECCYATADKKAASYAFPGSVVHEVFHFRSWASTRLMTAEQRAELLKLVVKDDISERISYKDCEKIAKELNLTLEQVLSVYSSKRRHCLNQFEDEVNENHSIGHKSSSSRCRKKKIPESRPAKRARIDEATDIVGMDTEKQDDLVIHSGQHATHPLEFQKDDHEIKDSGANEYEHCYPLIRQCVLSKMKPTRQRRFAWSEETDRQLVIQYVRHRAVRGAKYHRLDWASISDLPAPPAASAKRMNWLNTNKRFRKAVMGLCTILSMRYAEHLEKAKNLPLNKDVESQETSRNEEAWDDFENKSIKKALDEALWCKKMSKLEGYDSQENEVILTANPDEIAQNNHGKRRASSTQKSRHRLDKKFTKFLVNSANVNQKVYESLAVSNAVELFKLVFLSISAGPQAPNLLADILRRYSEHDLYSAFNYLREKKIMIGGNGSQPFELSQQFLHSVSKSTFPFNTGRRAVKFSAWLQERDKEINEVGTNLAEDLQCGDIFHLFALVSSGELSISPCLPDDSVGEAEDLRNAKRKSDVRESFNVDKAKKQKSLFGVEGEIISRREKGFPGINISVCRATISRANTLDLFKDNETFNNGQTYMGDFHLNIDKFSNSSLPDHMLENINSCGTVPIDENHTESPWEAMACYARHLMLVSSNQEKESAIGAEVFRVVHAAIQKAGDQGLSMQEIAQVIDFPGADVDGLIVDVLQAFGRALKVNAYDSVRVVDSLYHCKYFLTSVSGFRQGAQMCSSVKSMEKNDDTCKVYKPEECDVSHANLPGERDIKIDSVHKVTILNLPHGDEGPVNRTCDRNEDCMQDTVVLSRVNHEREMLEFPSGKLCVPILPWMNGDGTINNFVYKGLRRRVLGIVMQNPGILEVGIIRQMHVLNPQSCRTLLELMVLDKHLIVRKMHQNRCDGAPSMLQNLIGSKSQQSKLIFREHFFANPMSTSLL